MKSCLMIIVVISTAYFVNAQIKMAEMANFTISKPYPTERGVKIQQFVKDGDILKIVEHKNSFLFQKFSDDNLNLVQKNVDLTFSKGNYITGFQIYDRYFMFFSIPDEENGRYKLVAREVDFENSKFFDTEEILLDLSNNVYRIYHESVARAFRCNPYSSFLINLSKDQSKIIVQYGLGSEVVGELSEKGKIGICVFDNQLKVLSNDIVTMPYNENKMRNIGFVVDERENVFILTKITERETWNPNIQTKSKVKQSKDRKYSLELIRVDGVDRSVTLNKITLSNNWIYDANIFKGINDEILIGGYYSKDYDIGANGVFLQKFKNSGKLAEIVEYEIPFETIAIYESGYSQQVMKLKEERGVLGMKGLMIKDISVLPDGDMMIIGERFYKTASDETVYNHYDDILVTKIAGNSELIWMKKIPKQIKGGEYSKSKSFYYLQNDDYWYAIIVDNQDNFEELDENRRPTQQIAPYNGEIGDLVVYAVDIETGGIQKSRILDLVNTFDFRLYHYRVADVLRLSANEFVFECYKKKKEDVMIKVSLKE